MRASRRGKRVYTKRGHGARVEPASPSTQPTLTTPQTAKPPAVAVPERVCPHGGVYFHEMPVCGLCPGEHDSLFGLAVLHIARMAAYEVRVASSTFEDCLMTAVMELVQPTNRKRILSARSPGAMAKVIAKRAIIKLYRSRSVKSLPVSKMNFGNDYDSELETVSQRLEYLDGMKKMAADAVFAKQCYERAKTFPGIDLMWNAKNFERLQGAIEEGRDELPSTPIDVWRVIDMRLGLSEGMGEHGWGEITEIIAPSWKPVTVRQVRYAFEQGLEFLKGHLIRTLFPRLTATDSAE